MFFRKFILFWALAVFCCVFYTGSEAAHSQKPAAKIYYRVSFSGFLSPILSYLARWGGYGRCLWQEERSGIAGYRRQRIYLFKKGRHNSHFTERFGCLAAEKNHYRGEFNITVNHSSLSPQQVRAYLAILNFVRTADVKDSCRQVIANAEIKIGAVRNEAVKIAGRRKVAAIYFQGTYGDDKGVRDFKFWVAKRGKFKNQIIKADFLASLSWQIRVKAEAYAVGGP